ncbi:MAG TPA: FAD:protein FMN transferase [Candidatus Saccharimonadales bacterium]|nr:FAD:protein FMN transferase [Candidatus Saccharimonadales bacterium]
MGGRLAVHLTGGSDERRADADARRVLARIARWADRITRHAKDSELCRLNADPRSNVTVRPTLAAALLGGLRATEISDGLVDIGLLDARLAAEGLLPAAEGPLPSAPWSLIPGARGCAVVGRPAGLHFDLDGIGKGWLADRALHLTSAWANSLVDADGDLAIRVAPGRYWEIAVDDPRDVDLSLAVLRLSSSPVGGPTQWGVATSGTSIHRWRRNGELRHHLIDPRTGAPAVTDLVQVTVVAGSAQRAEALAKAAVIAGSFDGLALLERAGVRGAVFLMESGDVLAMPETLALLAA